MGYLVQIFLALGAVGLAEGGTAWSRVPLAVPLLALVPQVLGRLARRALLAGRFRRGARLGALLSASPPLLFLASLSVFGWHESVAAWTGSRGSLFGWPDLGVLCVLTPFVLYQASAIDAKARANAGNEISRKVYRALHLRMFLASLSPAFLYVLISAAVGRSEVLRVSIEEVELLGSLFSGGVLLVLALFLPVVLRNTWQTEPFPAGVHKDLLERVAARADFRCRDVLVWRTGNLMANAAIVGLGPKSRYVLFSDALLGQLGLRELAAVFAHEIGHAARRHVPVFLCWTLAFFLALGFVGEELGWVDGAAPFGLLAVALVAGYFAFGFMSRRFELDADLYAMELLGDPEAMVSALEQVGGRLRDVAGWRHFSVADRVAFLRRAALDPRIGLRLRRTVRAFALAGVAALVVVAGLEGRRLLESWDRDQLHVDLRLGRYERAAERLADRDDEERAEERAGELVAQARRLVASGVVGSEDELTSARLAELAQRALADRDGTVALRLLELGVWRGEAELVEPAVLLDDALAGGTSRTELRVRAAELEAPWRELLARYLGP